MDISCLVKSSLLKPRCAHCGHREDDGYESLDDQALLDIHCSGCRRAYVIAVLECDHCGEESLFSWTSSPTPDQFAQLNCVGCRQPLRDDETFDASSQQLA